MIRYTLALCTVAALAASPLAAQQGHGKGHGHGEGGGEARPAQGHGREAHPAPARAERARPTEHGRAARATGNSAERRADRAPTARVRAAATRGRVRTVRNAERALSRVAERGRGRGLGRDAVAVAHRDGRVRLTNRRGELLVDMDDDRLREMGAWRLRRLGDRQPAGNAPAFCRSGAGHPVWGRDWCLQKGFGLGSQDGTLWSRGAINDVTFRRTDTPRLDRGGLLDVLGDVVLGRLALQAVTLGYDQPLMGLWLTPPSGPRILQVHSGSYPVAELVDTNRDNRAEVLYVVQPF